MEKQALNKYEKYLYSQPESRKFEDPTIQRAFNNLQKAKSSNSDARILSYGDGSPSNVAAIAEKTKEEGQLIRKNRGKLFDTGKSGIKVSSPFSTKKNKAEQAISNDVLPKSVVGKKSNGLSGSSLPKDPNRYLQRALKYVKKSPIKAGLLE